MRHRSADIRHPGLGDRVRRRFRRLLRNARDHYLVELPMDIGPLAFFLLRQFFKGVALPPKQTAAFQALPKDAVVILVNRREDRFERLFYYCRYRETGNPVPTLAFDQPVWIWQPLSRIARVLVSGAESLLRERRLPDPYGSGFWQRALLENGSALLSLTGPRGFQRHFVQQKTDPLAFLVELQRSIARPIVLVPHIAVYSKKPKRLRPGLPDHATGADRDPGIVRRTMTLFKKPGRIFVEISEPLDLKTFLREDGHEGQDPDQLSVSLRRRLLETIHKHRQSIVGPVLKSRMELKQNLLTSARMTAFLEEEAAAQGLTLQQVHQKADACFEEIAANYNPLAINAFDAVLTWTVRNMFDGVLLDHDGLDAVKRSASRCPVILLPCHKSHIDYLMLSYVMHHNDMPCPHVVAGKNLSFWPLGPLFRSGGAFFLRRTFKGDTLYAGVFAAYVAQLLREGFNIEVFIEGGRSRTGKLLTPKTGFLSILLDAYHSGACADLALVPVFIGYDKVPEEKAYLHELEGGKKEPESLSQVIRARKFLRKRFGKIYIEFAEPMRLSELIRTWGFSARTAPKTEREAFCRYIGHRTINAINRVGIVTPHCIAAAALLHCPKERFSYGEVGEIAEAYCRHLQFWGAKLADTLSVDPARSMGQAFDDFLQRKWVESLVKGADPGDPEARFSVPEGKRPSLEYYKNTGVMPFVPGAFTALTVLSQDAFQFSSAQLYEGYRYLQEVLKYEFSFDLERPAEHFVRRSVKSFIEEAVLMPHPALPDTYNITSAGLRKLRFFARFCRPYLEAYLAVIDYLSGASADGLSEADHLKKVPAHAQRMLKRGDIVLRESVSRVTFRNALAFCHNIGAFGREDGALLATHAERLRRFLDGLE